MQPGDLAGHRFELQALAGSGGMGEVYRARDRATGEAVAVKVLLGGGAEEAARFEREAQVLAELCHPAIVRYVTHGVTPAGELYLAMEWLEGEDLRSRLNGTGLTIEESLKLATRVAEALGAAHARGIVHRDLKPSNLFLPAGQIEDVKLLDFGIAHLGGVTQMTRTGLLLGTPGYMAPEQARGVTRTDARADVFSLGCVLYECLTGVQAFSGDHLMAVLAKILMAELPPPSELRSGIPGEIDALVARMLAKNPDDRFGDGSAVAHALKGLRLRPSWLSDVSRPPQRPSQALTDSEQRALSVVLIGGGQPIDLAEQEPETDRALRREAELAGGHFERLADGTLAVVMHGAAVATDLAAQAARCALALRPHAAGRPLALAMGRAEITGQFPMSHAIDRAARLMDGHIASGPTAEIRPIALDEVTAGLLDARFDVREDDTGYRLRGERELGEGTRTLLGKATPCVGRERELHTLEALWSECIDDGLAQAVLITAPPGGGKSRLAHEFLRYVKQRGEPMALWTGRGDCLRASSAFALLGQIVRSACAIRDSGPIDARREKLLAHVLERVSESERRRATELAGEVTAASLPDPAVLPLHATLHDPELMNEEMRAAFVDLLAAECERHPVLIVLEDLHWGDRPTAALIDRVLRELSRKPILILAMARPEVHEIFPRLWADRRLQEIRLNKLGPKAVARLARHVLAERAGKDTIERLAQLSEGNAFYLEELIRATMEGHGTDLPQTVVAMVQSRLGALDDALRRVLRAASIFGEAFCAGGVAALLGVTERPTGVRDQLRQLVQQELVVQGKDNRFPGEDEYAFRHALLREGAYAMLTPADVSLGHRLAGQWLEAHGEQDALVLAEHFDKGGEGVRAGHHYLRAAEKGYWAGDASAAVATLQRALACELTPATLLALLGMLCEMHFVRPDLTSAVMPDAEELARVGPEAGVPWVADEGLGYGSSLRPFCFAWTLAERGAVHQAREWASVIVASGRAQHLALDEGRGRWVLAEALRGAGEFDAADVEITAALDLLRMGCPLDYPGALATLAALRLCQGRPAEALAAAEEGLAKYESMGTCGFFRSALLRLVHAESLEAAGHHERACAAIARAREIILANAAKISASRALESFLESVPEHARTLELAHAWLGDTRAIPPTLTTSR
jgi:tetratricopeptide (TPR) repeat protein